MYLQIVYNYLSPSGRLCFGLFGCHVFLFVYTCMSVRWICMKFALDRGVSRKKVQLFIKFRCVIRIMIQFQNPDLRSGSHMVT